MSTNDGEENSEPCETEMNERPTMDPFDPSKLRVASATLESLRKTSLTIFNLSTPCVPLPGYDLTNDVDDDLERRYDLAVAIAKHANNSKGDFASKRPLYHLALMEYYKLLRLDFGFVGALESVMLLLAVLGYSEHCLGLMDFCVSKDHAKSEYDSCEDDNQLEWVYGTLPSNCNQDDSLEERLEEGQQWRANAFLVPCLLISIRNKGVNKSAHIGSRIEKNCNLPVMRGLLVDSNRHWGDDEAQILLANPSRESRETIRWETNCLLFWRILKEYIDDTDRLHYVLQDTISYMETILKEPPIQEKSPRTASSLMDLFCDDNPQTGKLHCLHCRQRLSENRSATGRYPRALRCSRCCVVHYCSRNCQKTNYKLHKERCKNIDNLKKNVDNQSRYDLAYSIVDLAYVSTDTIDRGRKIYHLALVEYYQLLQLDFHYVGALESTLILLTILGYDHHLLGLIDFIFHRLEHHPQEKICIRDKNGKEDERLLEWAQGFQSPERKALWANLERIEILEKYQWGTTNFLLPLLFWSLSKQTRQRKDSEISVCLKISATLGRAIEQSTMLPVLRGLLPDSIQRWTQNEASELLCCANAAEEEARAEWSESCLLFWEILKDAIAFTPKLADALEETIDTIEKLFQVSAHSEAPHDLNGYVAWSTGATL